MTGPASEDEAAAIAAAIACFEAATAPAQREDGVAPSPWQQAALIEGVGGKAFVEDTQGGSRWLS